MADKLLYPSAAPDRQTPDFAAALELTVYDRRTYVTVGSITDPMTITLAIDSETPDQSDLFIQLPQDAAAGDNVTLGTGFSTNSGVTGVADDVDVVHAVYNKPAGTFDVVSVHKAYDAA